MKVEKFLEAKKGKRAKKYTVFRLEGFFLEST